MPSAVALEARDCYLAATPMPRTPPWFLASLLLTSALPTAGAWAQGAEEPPPSDPDSEVIVTPGGAEVVVEEPDVPGRDAVATNAELLDSLLTISTEKTMRQAKFAAAAGITGGMILIGLATWRLIEDTPQSQYTRGLGVMFMTLGMIDLTTGVFAATRITHEKRRLDRWEKAHKDGITDLELAHFEGELQGANETREGERLLVRWNGLTHALAGLLVIAFSPIPDMGRTDRVSAYIIGGLFVATGTAAFALSFRPTPSEEAWQEYQKRKAPQPAHEFSWRLSPSVSKRGFGLSVGATF